MQSAVQPEPQRAESPRSLERSVPRRFASTPLQNSQLSSPITESSAQSSPRDLASPTSSRGGSGLSYSPRSPREVPLVVQLPPASPAAQKEDAFMARARFDAKDASPVETSAKSSPLTTPRADPPRQGRNVSAPITEPSLPRTKPSPPQSPGDLASLRGKPARSKTEQRLAPRTSSIDSTMSSNSSTTTYSQVSQDPLSPNPAEIAQLIAQAGSAEAVISNLVKERKQAANQNAQLFRLVQKQRSLIYGLNQDLDKAVKEREKYRKRLRDESAHMSPARDAKVDALRRESPAGSTTSTVSEDELPIQRHSMVDNEEDQVASTSTISTVKDDHPFSTAASAAKTNLDRQAGAIHTLQQEDSVDSAEERDSRRNTVIQSPPIPAIAPLSINKRSDTANSDSQDQPDQQNVQSPSSFAARRSFNPPRKTSNASALSGGQSPTEDQTVMSPSTRKGPPAPLNLSRPVVQPPQSPKSPEDYGPEDHSGSDYDSDEVDELTGLKRGRKKTREEDDRERQILIQREHESRSQSKKQKGSKPSSVSSKDNGHLDAASYPLPKSPAVQGFAPASPNTSLRSHLSPHASIAGMLSGPPSSTHSTFVEIKKTVIASPPMSPGLPVSPRPVDRPIGAPTPRQPRDGYITSPPTQAAQPPVSPREPVQLPLSPQFPQPPVRPTMNATVDGPKSPATFAEAQRSPKVAPDNLAPHSSKLAAPKSPLASPRSPRKISDPTAPASGHASSVVPSELMAEGVFRGFVTAEHPSLLLPPNALPSITIKVTSSRLKPSRQSMIILNGPQEEPVFTLGIFARAGSRQLWRVEKAILSLPQLDYQLHAVTEVDVKLPERSLFSGHSPAKIDARRAALESYFESLLDMQMSEKAALVICQYLSTQVVPADDSEHANLAGPVDTPNANISPEGRIVKEGFLTKRGKQFGGWKARFFVLDDSILRYYDSPGGSLQGTIKLYKAQIGRQSAHSTHSPHRDGQNPESQLRHAFLILEPKKKDSNSHMRHVLCAENDEERDDWVYALLQYVNTPPEEPKVRPSNGRSDSGSKGSLTTTSKKGEDGSSIAESDRFNTLQGVSYEDTTPGEAPIRSGSIPRRDPASPSTNSFSNLHINTGVGPSAISGPRNGTVIQDAGAWGNKSAESTKKEKEQKKRSIWGFRERFADLGSHANNPPPSATPRTPHSARPKDNHVFGVPLREAVEYCTVPGSNLCLPAVVYRCIEYLDAKNAASEEGIFRLSGSNVVIKQLKEKFDTEGDFDIVSDDNYWDVHAVASLLKLYLRELPTTVLTREMNPQFLDALDVEDKQERLLVLNNLVHKLPLPNWTLVRALSQYLLTIITNSQVNKMSVRNVGIVFAPTLNIPAPVFSAFLTDFEAIFIADPLPSAASIYVQPASPEEARSALLTPGSAPGFNSERSFGQMDRPMSYAQGYPEQLPNEQSRRPPMQGPPLHGHTMGRASPAPSSHSGYSGPHYAANPGRSGTPVQQSVGRQAPIQHSPQTQSPASFSQPRELNNGHSLARPSYETPLPVYNPSTAGPQSSGFSYTRPTYETHVSFEPARNPPPSGPPPPLPRASLVTPPERPKYASGLGVTELMRDSKARRRESSLMMMPPSATKRKSSMPALGNMPE